MATLLLKQAVNGVISNLGAGVHPTQGNSIYSLTVEGTSNIPEGLELLREGDDLIFSVKGEEVSRLTEFYSDEMVAQVSVNGSLDAATAEIGTSTLAEIEGGGVVWPESESLATWGEQESLFSPSNLAIGAAAAAGVAVAVDDDDSSAPPLNVTILGGTETPTNSDVTFTITFDQAVSDFTAAAIDVTGGTKGTFTQISETEYTLVVAPAEDSVADITVDIAEGAVRSRAGAPSEVAEQETQAVDTLVAAPIAELESAASGGFTNSSHVNVSGLEEGASWEYQLPGSSDWVAGSTNVFEIDDAVYADDTIKVRQTDAVGNVSEVTTLGGFTVDTTIEDPTIDIASDSALSSDRITNDENIQVGNIESGASWEYSTDGGSSW
ncbi:MAG: Ig-like domain-containing protein, partial [Porticoccaceae bacterium]